jgi:hypothetical protein
VPPPPVRPPEGPCDLPACFNDLIGATSTCTGSGACVEEVSARETRTCWANGVKRTERQTTLPGGSLGVTLTSTKPDGTTCFSAEVVTNNGPSDVLGTVTLRDGAGRPVGAADVRRDGSVIVSCPGLLPKRLPPSCQMTMDPTGPTACRPGTCR